MADLFETEDLEDDSDDQTSSSIATEQAETESELAIKEVMNELLDEMALGLCFEAHRACKLGTLFLDESDEATQKQYAIYQGKGKDVFGQGPVKRQYDCICPNCQRNLAASRFAPHLEKCMGMGRNSSRLASRRLANHRSGRKESDNESDDNENDHDWNIVADKRAKKLKKERATNNSSPRRNRNAKHKNGDLAGTSGEQQPYESMNLEERKAFLVQVSVNLGQKICGVESEHTKKMCTSAGTGFEILMYKDGPRTESVKQDIVKSQSARCPQHTDEQRRAVRQNLLGKSRSGEGEEVHIDIDTYDDSESQILRDALQWEAQSNPSPADSNSTTGSNSKKKRSKPKKKSKSSANNSNSGTSANTFDFI